MSRAPIIKSLNKNGITTASDGLLHDWLSRGIFRPSLAPINEAILKRQQEIVFLKNLRTDVFMSLPEEKKKDETVS